MEVTRRMFIRATSGAIVASALGFDVRSAWAQSRELKLARTTETRSTCPYCSVSCGVIMYTLGDSAKNNKPHVIHVEGDPDHPVNRGTLCPKGAGLLDMINSPNRVKYPEYRAPGTNEWKRLSWDDALDRITKLMKDDRDKNFVSKNAAG